jgi:hypothetical protein
MIAGDGIRDGTGMATPTRARGFWRGFVTGLVVAAAVGLALAFVFPPVPSRPPEVGPDATTAPAGPEPPEDTAEPAGPAEQGMLPASPTKPLIEGMPTPEVAPAVPGYAGSPSLLPQTLP